MRILFLTNNEITFPLYEWLKGYNYKIDLIFRRISLADVKQNEEILIISYNYKYVVEESLINRIDTANIINLHISYLPWNRGAHPNIWSFVENTPKGVTIHQIDSGVDSGDILLQKKVEFDESNETLKSSYEKLHFTIQKLFKENWDDIKNKSIKPRPQKEKGSFHKIKDFEKIKPIINKHGWDLRISDFKRLVAYGCNEK